jgi:hypothetical protein
MATLKEEFELLKARIASGHGNETVHVVWVDREKRARKSPGHKTRFTFDLLSNELYREIWNHWDRVLTQVVNVTVARHIVGQEILRCFRELTPERIKELLELGENDTTTGPKPGPAPPRAEIPAWLKD